MTSPRSPNGSTTWILEITDENLVRAEHTDPVDLAAIVELQSDQG